MDREHQACGRARHRLAHVGWQVNVGQRQRQVLVLVGSGWAAARRP